MPKPKKARAIGFNHVALEVGDIDEALAFYGRLFKFTLRGRVGGIAVLRDRADVGGDRVKQRPVPGVTRIGTGCRGDPHERSTQYVTARVTHHAAPRYVLHQPVHGEACLVLAAGGQGICLDLGERGALIDRARARHRDVEQGIRDRLW